jgi:hypothetical protein
MKKGSSVWWKALQQKYEIEESTECVVSFSSIGEEAIRLRWADNGTVGCIAHGGPRIM